jgi:ABC-type transporter Mla subunit MlaD
LNRYESVLSFARDQTNPEAAAEILERHFPHEPFRSFLQAFRRPLDRESAAAEAHEDARQDLLDKTIERTQATVTKVEARASDLEAALTALVAALGQPTDEKEEALLNAVTSVLDGEPWIAPKVSKAAKAPRGAR